MLLRFSNVPLLHICRKQSELHRRRVSPPKYRANPVPVHRSRSPLSLREGATRNMSPESFKTKPPSLQTVVISDEELPLVFIYGLKMNGSLSCIDSNYGTLLLVLAYTDRLAADFALFAHLSDYNSSGRSLHIFLIIIRKINKFIWNITLHFGTRQYIII